MLVGLLALSLKRLPNIIWIFFCQDYLSVNFLNLCSFQTVLGFKQTEFTELSWNTLSRESEWGNGSQWEPDRSRRAAVGHCALSTSDSNRQRRGGGGAAVWWKWNDTFGNCLVNETKVNLLTALTCFPQWTKVMNRRLSVRMCQQQRKTKISSRSDKMTTQKY